MKKHYNYEDTKSFSILFNDASTHEDVLKQFVNGLVKNKFAPRGEIIEMLEDVRIIL